MASNYYKTIFLDVALAQTVLGLDTGPWLYDPINLLQNRGAIVEAFVEQELLDYSSKSHTREGKKYETELYFALEKLAPDFKLFLGEIKNKEREILLDGTFEQLPDKVILRLRIIKGTEILAQFQTDFGVENLHKKTLVAVLDIESDFLKENEKRAYSNLYRSALAELGAFAMANMGGY